jgi:ABC-2 type transport system permease protein
VKNIWLLIWKDFIRRWRNPVVIIGFLLIPVFFTFIFGLIFGPEEEKIMPRISVLAVDKDQGILSNFLLGSFEQGELKELIDLKPVEEEEGRKLMDKGKASALLIIPEHFEENIWKGRAAEIHLLKNPSEQFLPQVVEEVCDITTLLLSSLFSVFSDELETVKGFIDQERFPDKEFSSLSVQVKDRIEGIAKFVFPPVISIKQKRTGEEEQESALSVYSYILPAMSIMFLLFIANAVFEDILKEKDTGALLRMSVSPLRISHFIWSKILNSAMIGTICTIVLVALGRIIFSIKWGNLLEVFLIIICLNVLIAGFISLLYNFVKTERQAGALLSSVIIVMSLLGGSMVPVENFPRFVLYFSKLTINYWGLEAFHKALEHSPFRELFPILLGMLIIGILFSTAGSYLLKNNLRKGLVK